jgi:hypothetical protein
MSIAANHPKAFLSHASEDKERFVLPFATSLRAGGVDAWVDRWEIKLGDSLVRKIFDEGLGKADAAIIILSSYSVAKPWVREELDSAFVAKVEGRIRLIPVVIENCEIPFALRHISHIRVADMSDPGIAAAAVVRTLFDATVKPALGAPPKYAQSSSLRLPGLEQSDVRVLMALGELYLARGRGPISRDELERALSEFEITPDLLTESLEMLEGETYIHGTHTFGGKYFVIKLTSHGAETAFQSLVPDMASIERSIAGYLVNSGQCDAQDISKELSIPYAIVEHVLNQLSGRGLIKTKGHMQGMIVFDVSARLKRALAG